MAKLHNYAPGIVRRICMQVPVVLEIAKNVAEDASILN
jgi:hypothetical protein